MWKNTASVVFGVLGVFVLGVVLGATARDATRDDPPQHHEPTTAATAARCNFDCDGTHLFIEGTETRAPTCLCRDDGMRYYEVVW